MLAAPYPGQLCFIIVCLIYEDLLVGNSVFNVFLSESFCQEYYESFPEPFIQGATGVVSHIPKFGDVSSRLEMRIGCTHIQISRRRRRMSELRDM